MNERDGDKCCGYGFKCTFKKRVENVERGQELNDGFVAGPIFPFQF